MSEIYRDKNLMSIHAGEKFSIPTNSSDNIFYDKKYNSLYNLAYELGDNPGITITDMDDVFNQKVITKSRFMSAGGSPFAYNEKSEILYVSDQRPTDVLNAYNGIIRAINTATKSEESEKLIEIGSYVGALAIDIIKQKLFAVSGENAKFINIYDLNTGDKVQTLQVSDLNGIHDIIVDSLSEILYVMISNTNNLLAYKLSDYSVSNIKLIDGALMLGKRMVFDPLDQKIFIPMIEVDGKCILSVIDTKTNKFINNIPVASFRAFSNNSLVINIEKHLLYFMSDTYDQAILSVINTRNLKTLDLEMSDTPGNFEGLALNTEKNLDTLYAAIVNKDKVLPIYIHFSPVEIILPQSGGGHSCGE